MCVVSAITDNYLKTPLPTQVLTGHDPFARTEIIKLRLEMEELKKLLKAAQDFDTATGQPHCEDPEKVDLIRKLCRLLDMESPL